MDGNVSPVFVAILGKRTFMNNYTTNPISTVAQVQLQPEYMRLPRPGTRDPVFGLPRTVLNELIFESARISSKLLLENLN